jgi:hyperosmotically inducible periplasmic protein
MSTARSRILTFCGTAVIGAALFATPALAQQPDNSKNNQGDGSNGAMTAQSQKENPSDRAISQKIRKSVMQDKTLSTYAKNIKIVTMDGKVTLKGPVRSDDEKSAINAKAVAVAGADNVTNNLEIAPAQ